MHLEGSQLGPELEREEYPTPFLPMARLKSPPSEACEDKVGEDATGDKGAGTKVAVLQQLLHQNCVKVDVYGWKNDDPAGISLRFGMG